MCKIFLKSNIGKVIKKKEHKIFTSKLIKFSKDDPLGFTYTESKISSRDGYKKEILSKLKSFVKENKHNISRKKRKKSGQRFLIEHRIVQKVPKNHLS